MYFDLVGDIGPKFVAFLYPSVHSQPDLQIATTVQELYIIARNNYHYDAFTQLVEITILSYLSRRSFLTDVLRCRVGEN